MNFLRKVRPADGWEKRPTSEGALTHTQIAEVISRWRQGETFENIAAKYGVTAPAIYYLIKRELPDAPKRERKRRGKLSEKQKQNAIARRKNGGTLKSIAKFYHTSAVAIHKATNHAKPPEGWPQDRGSKKTSQ